LGSTIKFTQVKSADRDCSPLRTAIFIDYEAWYWGLQNTYMTTPDPAGFLNHVKQNGKIQSISVFGPFSEPHMKNDVTKLRTITNNIIDCTSNRPTKDYTDFIMLDHIYRHIMTSDSTEQYCILTGDGHFSSVTTYLTAYLDRVVGIYGVSGTINRALADSASWVVELQNGENTVTDVGDDRIVNNVLMTIMDAERKGLSPLFDKVSEASARYYGDDLEETRTVLSRLIMAGFVVERSVVLQDGRKRKFISPNWDLVLGRGLLRNSVRHKPAAGWNQTRGSTRAVAVM